MKAKKTIGVKNMLEWANNQLKRTDEYATMKFKAGVCTMIEHLLMESGNYMGYNELEYGSEYTNQYCRYYYTSNNLN